MPNFDMAALRNLSRNTVYGWNQNDIDLAVSYLHSRGWRMSKTTQAKGQIVPELQGAAFYNTPPEEREQRNNIHNARFAEPGTPGSCGVQKALKRALRLARSKTELKKMVAQAQVALARNDYSELKYLLERIQLSVGG